MYLNKLVHIIKSSAHFFSMAKLEFKWIILRTSCKGRQKESIEGSCSTGFKERGCLWCGRLCWIHSGPAASMNWLTRYSHHCSHETFTHYYCHNSSYELWLIHIHLLWLFNMSCFPSPTFNCGSPIYDFLHFHSFVMYNVNVLLFVTFVSYLAI